MRATFVMHQPSMAVGRFDEDNLRAFFQTPSSLTSEAARTISVNLAYWELGPTATKGLIDGRSVFLLSLWNSRRLRATVDWNNDKVTIADLAFQYYRRLYLARKADSDVAGAYAAYLGGIQSRLAAEVNPMLAADNSNPVPKNRFTWLDQNLQLSLRKLENLAADLSADFAELTRMERALGTAFLFYRGDGPRTALTSFDSVQKMLGVTEALSFVPMSYRENLGLVQFPRIEAPR